MPETKEPLIPAVMEIEYQRSRLTVNFFRTICGANVYISHSGKFYVCLANLWHCKPTLAKIEREIINFAKGVGIKVFYHDGDKVHVEEIIGLQGTRIVFRSGNSVHKHSHSMFRYDEKLVKQFSDYFKRKTASEEAFDEEWTTLSNDLSIISSFSIEKALAEEAQKVKS